MPARTAAAPEPPLLGVEPSAGGLFEAVDSSRPLTGEALTRAKMSRQEILASVKQFTAGDLSADTPATAPATQSAPHDPPAQAVKYYLQGRSLFLDGSNSEAMDALEKALALDPDSFTVLRLMGRVCFAASQLARGSIYLQRAYRLAPDDMEVNYLLGRYWLERKDNDRAVFYLLNADRVKTRGEAQAPLVSFYLGRALQDAHYHAAAAQAFEQFLAEAALPVPGYRYDRELSYLLEEQWAGELEAAENDVQIAAWNRAELHFENALEAQPGDAYIASRLLNAQVHARGINAARQTALAFVKSSDGSADSLKLLVWAYQAAGAQGSLITDVQAVLHSATAQRRAEVLAAAYDALGQKDAAFDTLQAYAASAPQDAAASLRLLKRAQTPAQFFAGMRAAAATLAADPDKLDEIQKRFAQALDTNAAADWAAAPPADLGDGLTAYLAAEALVENDGPPARIDAAFKAALRGAPAFLPARRGYVDWLISQDRFTDAAPLVDQAAAHGASPVQAAALRISLLAGQERLTDALAAAQDAAQKNPDDADLRLRLAAIDRVRGQTADSDRQLTLLIEAQPTCGPAYEALIDSLLERVRTPGPDNTGGQRALTDAVSWLGRLVAAVPTSIFGQVTTATLYTQVGRAQDAETMMLHLAADHPDDPDVAIALARARQANGKADEAASGLENALAANPSPALVAGLAQLYRTQGKTPQAAELVQRMAREHLRLPGYAIAAAAELTAQKNPDAALTVLQTAAGANPRSQEIALLLARRLAAAGRNDEAVAALEQFIQRNGETTDRLYELSHLYAGAGRDPQAEQTLQRVLAILPTHTGAANDLGYYWADSGSHLDQAQTLIAQAVEQEPGNGAFLDSMGWVLYKQGKFAQALIYLQRALPTPDGQSAEVVGHVGDALYRAGRPAEAAERWRQAQAMLDEIDTPLPKEEQTLKTYLEKVLAAVNAGKPPDVTPIAQPATPPRAATR